MMTSRVMTKILMIEAMRNGSMAGKLKAEGAQFVTLLIPRQPAPARPFVNFFTRGGEAPSSVPGRNQRLTGNSRRLWSAAGTAAFRAALPITMTPPVKPGSSPV